MSIRRTAKDLLRSIKRRVLPPDSGYCDWEPLLEREAHRWNRALEQANGANVLIGATIGRFKWEVNFDSALAIALTLRGARVHFLVCDRQVAACSAWVRQTMPDSFEAERDTPQKTLCDGCYDPTRTVLSPLRLPIHAIGELANDSDVTAIVESMGSSSLDVLRRYELDGVAVGEHAIAGAIRFFACARLEDEPNYMPVVRRYFHAAVMTALATRRLTSKYAFAVASGSHGIYVPQGIVSDVARRVGVRVVNWHQAYRKQCVLFSHGNTYHKTLLDEPASEWLPTTWSPSRETEIMEYLDSRQYGKQDWISFHREPDARSLEAVRAMGVDFNRPVIGLLTNVAWDAQLHYGATPFRDMMSWLTETIAFFAKRPDLQLLIRVHPAEVKGYIASRQRAVDEIRSVFPTLPPNVFVIEPESAISTYETMERCDAVIIYATKTGIELSARGVPVIVAGEAWIKNKGFAIDALNREDYFRALSQLPLRKRLSPEQTLLARKYAYHFFMRRMIPVSYLDDKMRPEVTSLADLEPGHDPGMDVICDGILTGSSFVFEANR